MRKLAPLVAASLAVVLGANVPAVAQKQGGTLRIYHRDNPPSASIHEEATISTVMPFMGVFNNLVMFDQHKKSNSMDTIVPDLAESWSWDESKTRLTFKLRQGVKWHDGKPFTAKDVKCTWDKLQGKERDSFRKNPRQRRQRGDLRARAAAGRLPDAARLRLFARLSLPCLDARHAH
jgi:peptide/nickel transport system substrate-binding protein